MKPLSKDAFKEKWPTKHTYLIQRLKDPKSEKERDGVRTDQVFGFGGGGSGLSEEAWALLKPCFAFDYMGAAEFEFGAFPKALTKMINYKLYAFQIDIPAKEIGDNFQRKHIEYLKKKGKEVPLGLPEKKPATIYGFCAKENVEYATDLIRHLAKYPDDWNRGIYLKSPSNIGSTLDPMTSFDGETKGWFDLDHGIFFFIDKSMFDRTKSVFQHWFVEEKDTASTG